ncbi:hypothetical protein DDK00_15045 [Mycobacteroides abscessus]|nr:hypothetical protein DDJ94_16235 [Mycobacteroides abscessus]PVA75527.1 hypothetical protein DDK00_15045 [Mycobacteroides abscessus]PVA85236.1 hypothetical protein DDJ75_15050 [Mycobacteroides abscessus]RIR21281.1 hypothetical protein D2E41_16250 [Mycobacteroides abscessus]RIU03090.1 hypothetical protein D2E84_05460 [Mycobacteroides abscessus]
MPLGTRSPTYVLGNLSRGGRAMRSFYAGGPTSPVASARRPAHGESRTPGSGIGADVAGEAVCREGVGAFKQVSALLPGGVADVNAD